MGPPICVDPYGLKLVVAIHYTEIPIDWPWQWTQLELYAVFTNKVRVVCTMPLSR